LFIGSFIYSSNDPMNKSTNPSIPSGDTTAADTIESNFPVLACESEDFGGGGLSAARRGEGQEF
jgi:hypothetical protein